MKIYLKCNTNTSKIKRKRPKKGEFYNETAKVVPTWL